MVPFDVERTAGACAQAVPAAPLLPAVLPSAPAQLVAPVEQSVTSGPEVPNDSAFEELLNRLEMLISVDRDSQDRRVSYSEFQGSVWRLASSPRGTHVVQEALANAESKDKVLMARELKGHVREAWESLAAPYANYVLQKCIEVMPPEHIAFVHKEMLNSDVHAAAKSKFGCRILQRLIEHFPNTEMQPFMDELLDVKFLDGLMEHKFGNFVVQCVLEHGSAHQKTQIAQALLQDDPDCRLARRCENKFASHVVQQCMKHCSDNEQRLICEKVLSIEGKDTKFKRSVYGSFVSTEVRKWWRLHSQEISSASPTTRALLIAGNILQAPFQVPP